MPMAYDDFNQLLFCTSKIIEKKIRHQELLKRLPSFCESVSVVRFSWLTSGQIVICLSFGPLQPAVVDICFAFLSTGDNYRHQATNESRVKVKVN